MSAAEWQGNDQRDLQCQATRKYHHQVHWATCMAWHWRSGPQSEREKAPLVWTCGMHQWCSQDSLWPTGWWKAWAWEAQDDMEAADREQLQRVDLMIDIPEELVWDLPCVQQAAIWKGAHWCGCCPCTCTLIQIQIMIMIWWWSCWCLGQHQHKLLVCSVTSLPLGIFWCYLEEMWNRTILVIYKNDNWLSNFWSYHPLFCLKYISCPLCNSNTLWSILMVFGRNVEQDETVLLTRMTTLLFLLLVLSAFVIFYSDYTFISCLLC